MRTKKAKTAERLGEQLETRAEVATQSEEETWQETLHRGANWKAVKQCSSSLTQDVSIRYRRNRLEERGTAFDLAGHFREHVVLSKKVLPQGAQSAAEFWSGFKKSKKQRTGVKTVQLTLLN